MIGRGMPFGPGRGGERPVRRAQELFAAGPLAVFNHLLAREPWAMERLAPFAGRTLSVRSPGGPRITATVTADGRLEPASAPAPDVELVVPWRAWPALPFGAPGTPPALEFTGDPEFAAALRDLAADLRWDVESDLARWVGDLAAHRIVGMLRATARMPADAAASLAGSAAEYAGEEQGLLAGVPALEALRSQALALAARLDALEARTAALEKRRTDGA